jgi:tripartite-type tricarboxylate transporter receptor subunit TctC
MRRPITLMVGAGFGCMADTVTRAFVGSFSMILNTPVVGANHPGAGGIAGTAFVARSALDDTTLLLGLTSMLVLPEADRLVARAPAYEARMLKSLRASAHAQDIVCHSFERNNQHCCSVNAAAKTAQNFSTQSAGSGTSVLGSIRRKRTVGRDCLLASCAVDRS